MAFSDLAVGEVGFLAVVSALYDLSLNEGEQGFWDGFAEYAEDLPYDQAHMARQLVAITRHIEDYGERAEVIQSLIDGGGQYDVLLTDDSKPRPTNLDRGAVDYQLRAYANTLLSAIIDDVSAMSLIGSMGSS